VKAGFVRPRTDSNVRNAIAVICDHYVVDPDHRTTFETGGGAITCMSCHERLPLDDDGIIARASVTAFIAAHSACPEFRLTLTLNVPDH
jgi:hypothetical protein